MKTTNWKKKYNCNPRSSEETSVYQEAVKKYNCEFIQEADKKYNCEICSNDKRFTNIGTIKNLAMQTKCKTQLEIMKTEIITIGDNKFDVGYSGVVNVHR